MKGIQLLNKSVKAEKGNLDEKQRSKGNTQMPYHHACDYRQQLLHYNSEII